jgi:hypothetical protein
MTVSETILQQLGGNKFRAMTGAKNFLYSSGDNTWLSFRLPSRFASYGINYVKITLDPSDTYTVVFSKIIKYTVKEISTFTNVYCDQLQSVFTSATGLDTHL